MITVIVSHEVKNYSDWKKAYDSDQQTRAKHGLKITGVYHSVEKPNHISVIGEAPSVEAVKSFIENPDLKAAMEKGGVIGMPDVKILQKV